MHNYWITKKNTLFLINNQEETNHFVFLYRNALFIGIRNIDSRTDKDDALWTQQKIDLFYVQCKHIIAFSNDNDGDNTSIYDNYVNCYNLLHEIDLIT